MTRFGADPMTARSRTTNTRRLFAAHAALAALALIGVAVVQTSWTSAAYFKSLGNWRLLAPVAILCTTAWALSTAWLHWRLRSPAASGRLAWQAVLDLLVAALAGFILNQGHLSLIALAGLWPIPPVLLALAVPSALVLLTALWVPPHEQAENSTITRLRTASVVALLLTLGWLATRPLPMMVSHPVDDDELSRRAGGPGKFHLQFRRGLRADLDPQRKRVAASSDLALDALR